MPLKRKHPAELILTQRARVGALFLQAVLTHVSDKGMFVSKLCATVRAFV